jgi:peptidoglycan/LPS O-acetylase OafA/YrhL
MAPALGGGWTLNYEMFFYALFALAVMLPRRQAVLAVVAVLLALTATRGMWPLTALNWWAARPIGTDLHGVVLEFAMGAVIALAYREGFTLPRWAALSLIAAGIGAFLVACRFALHEWSLPLFWGLPCAAVVAGCVFAGDPTRTGAIWRSLVVLGDASYALYLTHGLVQFAMRTHFFALGKVVASVSPWFYTGAISLFCAAIGLVVYAVIERPITDALRSRLRRDHTSLGRVEGTI